MTFDPNFILKGLDGNPLRGHEDDIHAGKVLANFLFYGKESRLKFHTWAMKLYNQEPIELDESDRKLLIDFLERSGAPAVTYVPLMEILTKLK